MRSGFDSQLVHINELDMVLPTGTTGSIPVRSTKIKIESYSKPELNLVKGIRPKKPFIRAPNEVARSSLRKSNSNAFCASDVIGSLT